MGGCRCTYRNCYMKSDGKTHMFHYPVFEKIRCHQWLVNAHRLDFLDLKVSQLKNRCVCQYHFTPDNFMNYKQDKLTFDAVPTENGPFCDPSKFKQDEEAKEYPNLILLEDIENDFLFNDKKSNFSIKYGDFLTNNEYKYECNYNQNNINLKTDNSVINLNTSLPLANDKRILEPRLLTLPKKVKTINSQPMLIVPPYSELNNELKSCKQLNIEQNIPNPAESNSKIQTQNTTTENSNVVTSLNANNSSILDNQFVIKEAPKVRILSEKKIKTPITITGTFKKISPSVTLILSDKSHNDIKSENSSDLPQSMLMVKPDEKSSDKLMTQSMLMVKPDEMSSDKLMTQSMLMVEPNEKSSDKLMTQSMLMVKPDEKSSDKLMTQSMLIEPDNNPSNKLKVLEVLDVEFETAESRVNTVHDDHNVINTDKISKITHSPIKNCTLIKNKVTPERSAAIERKRRFNMRLKDVIESCLDKHDEPVKKSGSDPTPLTNSKKPNSINKCNIKSSENLPNKQHEVQSNTCVNKDKTSPNIQEYTIAFLESRMKKMENTLLSKIEQNAQRIMDLKDSRKGVEKCKELHKKKSVSTQTNANEHCYKKFLYREISKYLSPTSNSIIFEELFINKFSRTETRSPVKRKRKK